MPAHDLDLGWHLLGGQWILEHGTVPSEDLINAFNPTWVDYHWLAQIGMSLVYAEWGFNGLRLALGLLMACLAKVLLDIIFRSAGRRLSTIETTLFFLGAMTLIGQVTSIRPQMIAILGVALALRRLLAAPSRFEIPVLFVLSVILTNIHVYWIFVPLLWFIYRCLPRLLRRRHLDGRYAWGGFVILLLAGFVSPYGLLGNSATLPFGIWTNYSLLLDYAVTTHDLKESIAEFRGSLTVDGFLPLLFIAYALVIGAGFNLRRFLVKFPASCSAALTLFLAFRTLKFMAIFGVMGLPLLSRMARILPRNIPHRRRKLIEKSTCILFCLSAAELCVYYFPLRYDTTPYFKELPLDACRTIASLPLAHSADKPVRVLTHFNYGGWCRWAIYQANPRLDYRVITDGRTQFVPAEHYTLSFDLFRLHYDWAHTLKSWAPDIALVEKNHALAQVLLRATGSWKMVYEDEKFALFVPLDRPQKSQ